MNTGILQTTYQTSKLLSFLFTYECLSLCLSLLRDWDWLDISDILGLRKVAALIRILLKVNTSESKCPHLL